VYSARTREKCFSLLWCGKLMEKPRLSGRGAAWLARLLGVQEVPGSNPGGPTKSITKRGSHRNGGEAPFGIRGEGQASSNVVAREVGERRAGSLWVIAEAS
jgi:hypothetical protein